MQGQLGLAHFWANGDAVSHLVAVVLLIMSAASWSIIAGKAWANWRWKTSHEAALADFWAADTLPRALDRIGQRDASGILAGMAQAATHAATARQDQGIGSGVSTSEFVTRALRNRITRNQADIEGGLTFLASVGSTAPFIGLFGTVWGIYHALVGLAGSTQVVLDKVAGPVGEALIMTAAGLFVAIPAVLAYNAFTRANRLILAEMDGFAHDLHAFLSTGGSHGGLRPMEAAETPAAPKLAAARV